MNIKKMAGTAAIAASLGVAGLGMGAGTAQADDGYWGPGFPWPPGPGEWIDVPGQGPTGLGAPGQLKKLCPPFCSNTPPGQWRHGPQGLPPFVPWR
jgi:hypothetical protein